jgi:hypothetical protein
MKLVVLALVLSLSSPVAAEKSSTEVSASEAKAWLDVFDKIVDAVVAHRSDCPTMAGDLTAIIGVSQDTIRTIREAKAKGKRLPASATQRMIDGSKRMMGSLDKCGRDEQVAAAFARIDLGDRKK